MYSNVDVAVAVAVALSKRSVKFVNLIQRQFTPVYALALSRPGANRSHWAARRFYIARRKKRTFVSAIKALPLGRAKSSLTNFRLRRGNLAAFCRPIRERFTTLSREKNDHFTSPESPHLRFRLAKYFSIASLAGVSRQVRKSFSRPPEFHTRERHFIIDCRKQWELLSERAWHA